MKLINKVAIYVLLLIGMNILSSCNDFLAEKPSTLTTKADLTSNDAARAYVDGVYENLSVLDEHTGYASNTLDLLIFITGKTNSGLAAGSNLNDLTYDSNAPYIGLWWQELYSGIKSANLAIYNLQNKFEALDDESKINLLAEAKTLRAFYYFYLVRIFGAVPKITETIERLDNINTPRSPAKEIYDDIIIPDLLDAEKSTLPWKDTSGHVSMGLIKSLLADVYLTYAGYPVQGGEQYYSESAKRSKEVIDSGAFELFDEYTDLIDLNSENSGEFIFQVQYNETDQPNSLSNFTMPSEIVNNFKGYNGQYEGTVPSPKFLNSFSAGDKRAKEKEFFFSTYKGINFNGQYIYKYFNKKAVEENGRSGLNFTVYRLADVMLMYAEASNRVENGPNSNAIQYVNDIRERADLDPISSMGMVNFEKEVWKQRYLELCFEGKQWFDMIRTRKVYNDETGEWENLIGHTNMFNATFAEKNLVFPIPYHELQNNNKLEQNKGY